MPSCSSLGMDYTPITSLVRKVSRMFKSSPVFTLYRGLLEFSFGRREFADVT